LQSLFHRNESTGVLRADFESEPYFGAGQACEFLLPSASVHHGVNTLLVSVPGGELTRSRVFTFRGARISRVP